MIFAGVPFQQPDFGNFGRTAAQKQNVLVLKRALGYLSLWTGDDWLIPQRVSRIEDFTSSLTDDLAVAVVELADKVLKKIGVVDEIPGLSTILSLAFNRSVVKGAYAAAKSTFDNGLQKLADWLAPFLSKAVDYIRNVRSRVGGVAKDISWTDLQAVVKWAIKGGTAPKLPSLEGEEEEAPTTPRFPWQRGPAYQPPGTAPGAKPGLLIYEKPPEIYPKGSFAVHDSSVNKWRIFVRTS